MTDLDPRAAADRFIAAQHALDRDGEAGIDAMLERFGADPTIVNSALRLAGTERRGADGARRFWADYCKAMHGAETTFHAVTCSERAAGLFWTTRLARDGAEPIEYDGATWLAFDDAGRVDALHGYYDTRALAAP